MKINRLWFLILTTAFLPLLAGCTRKSDVAVNSTPPGPPTFYVCQGTYALCTTAKCTSIPVPAGSPPKLLCSCDVKQGYSAGAKSCQEVTGDPPHPGQSIRSRYFPIKWMAVCSNSRPWASCLDSPCAVDADTTKAKCTCEEVTTPTQTYVVTVDSYNGSTCTTDIWSSANVEGVFQITAFLQDSELKPFPISVVGVEPAKK